MQKYKTADLRCGYKPEVLIIALLRSRLALAIREMVAKGRVFISPKHIMHFQSVFIYS